ncbi:MAG: hypothetical protein EBV82_00635 [Chitinophagia bacterium]|jgi:hypothetical protein|nr:hypothetical protein [Chitinophagia bacterium]
MNKKFSILLFLLLGFVFISNAQNGHLVLLKDRGVTVRSFSKGDYINFQFSSGQWITGYIDWIKSDTIQVNQFALQKVINGFGLLGEDTLRLGRLQLHVNEIKAFAKDRGHFKSVFTNGIFLETGGLMYVGLNLMNSTLKGDAVFGENNIPKLVGGVVVYGIGRLIQKSNPDYRPIGKRFSVEIL